MSLIISDMKISHNKAILYAVAFHSPVFITHADTTLEYTNVAVVILI